MKLRLPEGWGHRVVSVRGEYLGASHRCAACEREAAEAVRVPSRIAMVQSATRSTSPSRVATRDDDLPLFGGTTPKVEKPKGTKPKGRR